MELNLHVEDDWPLSDFFHIVSWPYLSIQISLFCVYIVLKALSFSLYVLLIKKIFLGIL